MKRKLAICCAAAAFLASSVAFTDQRFVPSGQSTDCSLQPEPTMYCLGYCNNLTSGSIPSNCLNAGPPVSWTITGAECAAQGPTYVCACYCQIVTGGDGK